MSQHPSETETSYQDAGEAKPGWFSRNWKWLVPTIILVPVLFCCVVPGVLMLVFKDELVNMVDAYIEPIALAEENAAAQAALGTPMMPGEPVEETTSDATTIALVYPISGPDGSGEIRAEFSIANPIEPVLTSAVLTVDDTGETIDLLIDTPEETEGESNTDHDASHEAIPDQE